LPLPAFEQADGVEAESGAPCQTALSEPGREPVPTEKLAEMRHGHLTLSRIPGELRPLVARSVLGCGRLDLDGPASRRRGGEVLGEALVGLRPRVSSQRHRETLSLSRVS
jgi:hypothetical protein